MDILLFAVSYLSVLLTSILIFVYKDEMWTIKGRYETAMEDNGDAIWTCENGQDVMRFLVVSIYIYICVFDLSQMICRLMISTVKLQLLPLLFLHIQACLPFRLLLLLAVQKRLLFQLQTLLDLQSEESRVGKECRSRWS